MSVFYTWLQVSNAKLQHWVISIRLQVKPFSVVHLRNRHSWHAWFSAVPGVWVSWLSKEREKKKSTPSQPVKCKTQNICTYLQIIAFLTRNQIKTFVSTQIHKCKRSVNRLFKGYLLIIYMKRRSGYLLWCWAWKLNYLIKLNDLEAWILSVHIMVKH